MIIIIIQHKYWHWPDAFFSPDFQKISEIIQKAVYARFLLRDILLRDLKHSQNIYQSISTPNGNCP